MDRRLAIIRLTLLGLLGVLFVRLSAGGEVLFWSGIFTFGVSLLMPVLSGTECDGTCASGTKSTQVQFDITGIVDSGSCSNCTSLDGTYVLDEVAIDPCTFNGGGSSTATCGGLPSGLGDMVWGWGYDCASTGSLEQYCGGWSGQGSFTTSATFGPTTGAAGIDCSSAIGPLSPTSTSGSGCDLSSVSLTVTPL